MSKSSAYGRVINVYKKEWETTINNLNAALFITLIPLFITGLTLLCIYLAARYAIAGILTNSFLQAGLTKLTAVIPQLAGLAPVEQVLILFYLQFPLLLLLIPVMISVSVAALSIIAEKKTGTLEPLLATPVRTWELLMGKTLAGAIPAVFISWVCAVIFLLGAALIGPAHLIMIALTPVWLISLLLLVPLVTILSFMLGVMASSRAANARKAQTIAVLVAIPIFALVVSQLTGVFIFTAPTLLLLALLIAIIDYVSLRRAVYLFQRETILTRWK